MWEHELAFDALSKVEVCLTISIGRKQNELFHRSTDQLLIADRLRGDIKSMLSVPL